MPLDVLGRTRATLVQSTSMPFMVPLVGRPGESGKLHRDGDRSL